MKFKYFLVTSLLKFSLLAFHDAPKEAFCNLSMLNLAEMYNGVAIYANKVEMLESRAYINGCYEDVERDPESNTWLIYTVTPDQLPSQYRSLKLYQAAIGQDEAIPKVASSEPRFSSKTVYVILAAIFVVSLALAATISCIEIRKVLREEEFDLPTNFDRSRYVPETSNSSAAGTQLHTRPLDATDRTPCVSTCRAYRKPKFRSSCVDGYCVCRGEGYQPNTCLAIVHQCAIRRTTDNPIAKAFLKTSPVPVYSCHAATGKQSDTSAPVHVLSIYGNHFADQTVVTVSGSQLTKTTPVILVLASHYPVHWRLKREGGPNIRRIVMISDLPSCRNTVKYSTAPEIGAIPPKVTPLNMNVGYGDDRHNSNTTEMLQTLTTMFASVTSFVGTAFADQFTIKI